MHNTNSGVKGVPPAGVNPSTRKHRSSRVKSYRCLQIIGNPRECGIYPDACASEFMGHARHALYPAIPIESIKKAIIMMCTGYRHRLCGWKMMEE